MNITAALRRVQTLGRVADKQIGLVSSYSEPLRSWRKSMRAVTGTVTDQSGTLVNWQM